MNDIPPVVRILPMDSQDEPDFKGRSATEVQHEYFLGKLLGPDRPAGKYWYHRSGLKLQRGARVLFQFNGAIIASAVLVGAERFRTPEEGGYNGAMYFDPNSIMVFKPVSVDVVRKIWPEVKRLGRAKWSLDPNRYPAFEQRLTDVETPKPHDLLDDMDDERRWEEAFARSRDKLGRLAAKVREDIRAGRVKNVGIDEL